MKAKARIKTDYPDIYKKYFVDNGKKDSAYLGF